MSRAYYGAFHLARDFVESCGVTLPKTAKAHDKLQWCLAQSGRIQLPPVAERLNSLRAARNVVDYDLTSWWFSKRGSVLVAIRRSLAKTETWRQGSSIQSPKPKTGSDPSNDPDVSVGQRFTGRPARPVEIAVEQPDGPWIVRG